MRGLPGLRVAPLKSDQLERRSPHELRRLFMARLERATGPLPNPVANQPGPLPLSREFERNA
jgi:hypothetical protein